LSYANIVDKSEIIVVDNASKDGSVSNVEQFYPKVKLIRNDKNYGFAKGSNQGIKVAEGKYILLLNSDTRINNVSLRPLTNEIRRDNRLGVVGGKLLNEDGSIQPSCGYFPDLWKVFIWMFFIDDIPFIQSIIHSYHVEDKSFYQKKRYIDWVTGACFMTTKEVIQDVGLIDEKIFMYGEEMEWCYRIKKKGYKILYTPESEIYHVKGASSSIQQAAGIIEELHSLIYFYQTHKSLLQTFILKVLLFLGVLLRIVVFGIIGRHSERIDIYVKAIKMVR